MHPGAIGPLELLIDEFMRRIPARDAGAPAHRDAMQPDGVVDQGTLPHHNRRRGEDVKAHRGRGDAPEICGVGEKRKDVIAGRGNGRFRFKNMLKHEWGFSWVESLAGSHQLLRPPINRWMRIPGACLAWGSRAEAANGGFDTRSTGILPVLVVGHGQTACAPFRIDRRNCFFASSPLCVRICGHAAGHR